MSAYLIKNQPYQYLAMTLVVVGLSSPVHATEQTTNKANPVVLPEMVTIPAGTFTMGCVVGRDNTKESGCPLEELPAHEVSIKAFQLAKTEVTNREYTACVNAGVCKASFKYPAGAMAFYDPDYPVVGVSWDDVQTYINWLSKKTGKNYRLPTEAEWEYAARAGSKTVYPWGTEPDGKYMNFGGEKKWDLTSPVGSYLANEFGLYDMQGNAWEWVQDRWHDNYKAAPNDGSAWELSDISRRVLRGCAWYQDAVKCRSAARTSRYPDIRDGDYGFRLALDIETE